MTKFIQQTRFESKWDEYEKCHGIIDHANGPEFLASTTIAKLLNSHCIPILKEGERYAGIILNDEGDPDYHLILLPEEAESIKWDDAKQWAADRNGELPTRREQSLLFANLKGEFKEASYWSGQHHEDERYAWYQDFRYGYQGYLDTAAKLRARAVRRVPV